MDNNGLHIDKKNSIPSPKEKKRRYSKAEIARMSIDEVVRCALKEGTSYGRFIYKYGGVKPAEKRKRKGESS